MKPLSDARLLAAVLGVPVGVFLLLAGIEALFGEPNLGETIAIGCAMVLLMLASLLPQMAGVRFATNGPRSLQNRLGFWGALFAMMLLGQMPNADQPLARAALGWLPLPLVIALIGGMDAARHIKSLRRHPRALRKVWLDMIFGVAFALILCASMALANSASPAQALWAGLVFCGAAVAGAGGLTLWSKVGQMSMLRTVTLALSHAISFAAMITIFIYVMRPGEISADEAAPMLIGAGIGSFFPILIMTLIKRKRALQQT